MSPSVTSKLARRLDSVGASAASTHRQTVRSPTPSSRATAKTRVRVRSRSRRNADSAAESLVHHGVHVVTVFGQERSQPLAQVLVELEPHPSSGSGSSSSVASAAP